MDMWTTLITSIIGGGIPAALLTYYLTRLSDQRKERAVAKNRIFQALMATRATRLAPDHVTALNMIDLEFSIQKGRTQSLKDKAVVNTWHEYADHLNSPADKMTSAQLEVWIRDGEAIFIGLLEKLSDALGYDFDRTTLKRAVYRPIGHSEAETRQEAVNRAWADIVTGKDSLPMKITSWPSLPN